MKYDEYKESKKKKEEENASLKILKSLAEKEDIDYSGLLEQIINKTIDLSDVLSAIKGIPTPEKTDISPVVEAIKDIKIEQKETIVNVPEQKPDIEMHSLLNEIIEELKKKSKKEKEDRRKSIHDPLKKLLREIEELRTDIEGQSIEFSASRVGAGEGSSGCGLMSTLQADKTQVDYWYYGGTDSAGVYKINRYNTEGIRTQATGDWSSRYSLTYS